MDRLRRKYDNEALKRKNEELSQYKKELLTKKKEYEAISGTHEEVED